MDDSYYTIQRPASREIKVKSSRFIGSCRVTADSDSADAFIAEVKKEHHSARHHCFAWRLGCGDETVFRYNDDGEPSGTAGRPILDAIEGRGLTGVVCVVTRYFGGVKLGTGGLARAYRECAALTLEAAGSREVILTEQMTVRFAYDLTGKIRAVVSARGGTIQSERYSEQSELVLEISRSRAGELQQALRDVSAGEIEIIT